MKTIVIRLRGLSYAARSALLGVLIVLLILLGMSINYLEAAHAIDRAKADENAAIRTAVAYADSQWCGALTLLTSHPTPKPSHPAANPSREGQYLFYEDLLNLEVKFGCKESLCVTCRQCEIASFLAEEAGMGWYGADEAGRIRALAASWQRRCRCGRRRVLLRLRETVRRRSVTQ